MSVLSDLRRRTFTKGLLGGSRPWLIVGIAAWTFRGLQWALRPSPTRVYRGKLEVGETLVISHHPAPPSRRKRRKMRKIEKRAKRRELRRGPKD